MDVKVNAKQTYGFYVINNHHETIDLIMEKNLVDKETFYNKNNDNRYGPQTILKTLATVTSEWTNIPIIIDYIYDGVGRDYTGKKGDYGYLALDIKNSVMTLKLNKDYGRDLVIKPTTKARLLTIEESYNLGCTRELGSCPAFLYQNLSGLNTNQEPFGYWLLSVNGANPLSAWNITYSGDTALNNVNYGTINGIRPVITIPKVNERS